MSHLNSFPWSPFKFGVNRMNFQEALANLNFFTTRLPAHVRSDTNDCQESKLRVGEYPVPFDWNRVKVCEIFGKICRYIHMGNHICGITNTDIWEYGQMLLQGLSRHMARNL